MKLYSSDVYSPLPDTKTRQSMSYTSYPSIRQSKDQESKVEEVETPVEVKEELLAPEDELTAIRS